jgi:hypothetical protein
LKEFQTGSSGDPLTVAGTFVASGGATLSGTNTLSGSTVMTASAGTSASPSIHFSSDTNTGIFSPAADTIAFAEGGAEAMRIDSSGNLLVGITSARSNAGDVQVSKGISFPASQSAQSDANTLDDYEEGTWTPTVSSEIGSITTVTSQSGTYVKIGKVIYFSLTFIISNAGTGSGAINVSSLPIAANTTQSTTAAVNWANGEALSVIMPSGSALDIRKVDGTSAIANQNYAASGFYFT